MRINLSWVSIHDCGDREVVRFETWERDDQILYPIGVSELRPLELPQTAETKKPLSLSPDPMTFVFAYYAVVFSPHQGEELRNRGEI